MCFNRLVIQTGMSQAYVGFAVPSRNTCLESVIRVCSTFIFTKLVFLFYLDPCRFRQN
jgi:hypothetical protein